MKKLWFILLMPLIAGFAQALEAAPRYVSDELKINLRTGQGNQYQILRVLPAGTRVEVLEVNQETGYSRVMANGREGWVLTQYLQDQPIARDRLAAAERRMEQLAGENAQLREERDRLRATGNESAATSRQLAGAKQALEKELEQLRKIAERPVELSQENQALRERTVTLEKDLQLLRQENQVLKDRSGRDWFVAGAGVLVFGMLLGFVLPKLRGQRKSGWDL